MTIIHVVLGQLRFVFRFIHRAISYFSFQSNCQQLQWFGVFIRKNRGDTVAKKNSPLTRFTSDYVTFLLACHIRVTCANYRRENQHPCARYPDAGRTNKNSSWHSLIFALSSLLGPINSARCTIEFRNLENRSTRIRICMIKDKTVRKTSGRIFRTCKFTREVRYFFAYKFSLRLK